MRAVAAVMVVPASHRYNGKILYTKVVIIEAGVVLIVVWAPWSHSSVTIALMSWLVVMLVLIVVQRSKHHRCIVR